jgi:hypothetical protein
MGEFERLQDATWITKDKVLPEYFDTAEIR